MLVLNSKSNSRRGGEYTCEQNGICNRSRNSAHVSNSVFVCVSLALSAILRLIWKIVSVCIAKAVCFDVRLDVCSSVCWVPAFFICLCILAFFWTHVLNFVTVCFPILVLIHSFAFDFACFASCVSMSWSHLCICIYIDVLRGSSCNCVLHAGSEISFSCAFFAYTLHSLRTRCDDSAIVFACEFPLRLLCRAFVGACASFAVRDFVVSHFCFHTPACVARLIVVRRFWYACLSRDRSL